jgi:hypothetical protein
MDAEAWARRTSLSCRCFADAGKTGDAWSTYQDDQRRARAACGLASAEVFRSPRDNTIAMFVA